MKSKSISMQNLLSVISSISICTTDSNNYHQYKFGGKIQSKTNCWSWTKLESRNPHEPYNNMALDKEFLLDTQIGYVWSGEQLEIRVEFKRYFGFYF